MQPVVLLKFKSVVVLGIITLLIMSFWVLGSMMTDGHGNMVSCPFINVSGSPSFCQMSISEHISQWKQLFAAIQGNNLFLSLFALSVLFSTALLNTGAKTQDRLKFQWLRDYCYHKKPEIKLFDHLVLAFSRGKIHPKIYA